MALPIDPVDGQVYSIYGEKKVYVASTDTFDTVPLQGIVFSNQNVAFEKSIRGLVAESNILQIYCNTANFHTAILVGDTTIDFNDVEVGSNGQILIDNTIGCTVSLGANTDTVVGLLDALNTVGVHIISYLSFNGTTTTLTGLGTKDV